MTQPLPAPESPSWNALLLVCKACRKRGSGPKGMKTRDVTAELRRGLKSTKPRPRVVTSSCLGLCPKRAVAIAAVAAGSAPRIVAVESVAQLAGVLTQLIGTDAAS
jgi:predicted metal-binding protein